MHEDQKQSPEERAASVLKEVNQKVEDQPNSASPDWNAPSAKNAENQIKGSDADVDPNVGFDAQPNSEEASEQVNGSDADTSQE